MRALAGAYLFGIPLLYTMEMWWIGTFAPLLNLALFLVVAFSLNLTLAHLSGFKHSGRGLSGPGRRRAGGDPELPAA